MEHQESLEDIQEKFEQWRSTRKNRFERIPAALWQSAAVLAQGHPIHVVSKALRLNGNDLKKQVRKYCGSDSAKSMTQPDFIEFSCDLPSKSSAECIVELADAVGAQMRIVIKGTRPDVPGLIASFWNRSR
jgi:hypothetical protein